MTASELEALVTERLMRAGLSTAVDRSLSQFLEFPDGLFAEIVLNDGSKLDAVEHVVSEVENWLRKRGTELDAIVRCAWTVQEIRDPHPAVGVSGGIRTAWAFPATLASGNRLAQVQVNVSWLVLEDIKKRLAMLSRAPEERDTVKEVVKEFLKMQLSLGGESYWNPMRYPEQDLNEAALSYLLGHSQLVKSS